MRNRLARRAYVESQVRRMRALDERLYELGRFRREQVLVELPEPVAVGWERYFFIRPDLDRSPEAPVLRNILPLIQHVEVSNRKDFARRDWQQGGKKVPKPHRPSAISEKTFWSLDEKLQRYFELRIERIPKTNYRQRIFVLKDPWKFVSRTRRYYITHRALPHSETLAEEAHIDKIQYGKGWPYRHRMRTEGWGGDRWNGYVPTDYAPLVLPEELP